MTEKSDIRDKIDGILAKHVKTDDENLTVIHGTATKNPSLVRVIEPVPLEEDAKRKILKEKSKNEDAIIRIMTGSVSDPQVLSAAASELADEIHSLKFQRETLESEGRDITSVSGKRVIAIKALIDTALKLKEMAQDEPVDFSSIQMQVVMRLIFSKIEESLKKIGYSKQDIQTFFQVFSANMETFQVEAQRLIDQEIAKA